MRWRAFAVALIALGLAGNSGCAAKEEPSAAQPAGGAGEAPSGGTGAVAGAAGMTTASGGSGGAGGTAGTVVEASGGMGGEAAGGSGGAPLGGMGGGMAGSGGIPAPTGPTLSASVKLDQVFAGDELTICGTVYLDNETEVKVKSVRGHISGGSHHFMVDRAPTDVPLPDNIPCVGLSGTDVTRILIAEKPETIFAMPEGVGFTLRPRQALTTELHYFNFTDAPIDIEATVELELYDGQEAENMIEASMVFTGNPAIVLLPGPGTVEFYMPLAGTPEAPARVFALTSHTHSLGVRSTIQMMPDALAESGTLVHESLSWAEPPMDEFDPPLLFTGSEGLLLRCEYENTRDAPVTFGTGVNDEMCFMWLYYY